MANLSDAYKTQEIKLPIGYKLMFTSEGPDNIIKAVQYTYVRKFEGRNVYNLGFGDYDPQFDHIIDQAKSNNGDAYKVFRTVLSTIPPFFENFPEAIIMVQGSDSRTDFAEKCRETCIRRCTKVCRKFNQRITLYRNYVEKNFQVLGLHYWFLGGFLRENRSLTTELYIPGRLYDAILFFRK
ncbi:DUF6934 family protein [Dyadobacter sp. Leaf189]|uniref:DUF6934 family protein n=1 Tax=Dyadobacter sp. Leaf189 TaxID=1736295 RepID=UPI0006F1F8B3|nr:hypothetical protein [Dyadobacter sp. Leaf189]KQS33399.1 hypothetical protein ASG33_04790 [Dyadobacter sp. Leaf189]